MSNEYEIEAAQAEVQDVDEAETAPAATERIPIDKDEYYEIPKASRICSVLSVICAVISMLLFPLYYAGIAFAVAAIVLSVVSSARLGYFDKAAIFGLVLGIFAGVFSAFIMALDLSGVLAALFGR